MNSVQELISKGLKAHQNGEYADAERCYRKALSIDRSNSDALHLLGMIALQHEKFEIAEGLIRKAISNIPNSPMFLNNLGEVFRKQGLFDKASQCYLKALKSKPEYPGALNNLGIVSIEMGRPKDSIVYFNRLLKNLPQHSSALSNLGRAYIDLEQFDKANEYLKKAVAADQSSWEAWNNLSAVQRKAGKFQEAIDSAKNAQLLSPQEWKAHTSLGAAHADYGNWGQAVVSMSEALRLSPNNLDTICNLGMLYMDLQKFEKSLELFEKALELDSECERAFFGIGKSAFGLHLISKAEKWVRKCLECDEQNMKYWDLLGQVTRAAGDLDEAEDCLRKAIALDNDGELVSHGVLLNLNLRNEDNPLFIRDQHIEWAAQFARPHYPVEAKKAHPLKERRLRVGLVSADWRLHPVAQFTEALLRRIDREKIELFCYSGYPIENPRTNEIAEWPEHWVDIARVNSNEFYELVVGDGVDILIDLMGHTSKSRLLTFARQAAPVQITYLGYPNTTGLETIQYRFTDSLADPEGLTDTHYTEKLYRLPESAWCFTPWTNTPEVSESPQSKAGFLTFGCFNNFSKISPKTLSLWAEILRRAPDAKLFLKTKSMRDEETCQRLWRKFENLDVSRNRIRLQGWEKDVDNHLELYGEVDIALDTYPYHGTTTTCEALHMGVPVVSLAGISHVSRVGVSLLASIGLEALCLARNDAEYIEKAVALASDCERLVKLRKKQRAMMDHSPLRDEAGFVKNFEEALFDIWKHESGLGS